jgi:hypothetical protein
VTVVADAHPDHEEKMLEPALTGAVSVKEAPES